MIHGKFAELSSLYTGGRGNGGDGDVSSVRDVLRSKGGWVTTAGIYSILTHLFSLSLSVSLSLAVEYRGRRN